MTDDEDRLAPPRFTLRGALAAYSVLGVMLSIPLIGLGFTLTAVILLGLFALQLPVFLLLGAFSSGRRKDVAGDTRPEWDLYRDEPAIRR